MKPRNGIQVTQNYNDIVFNSITELLKFVFLHKNKVVMTSFTVDEKTIAGKKLVEYLKTLNYVSILRLKPSTELKQAIKEAEEDDVIRGKNVTDLLQKLKE